MTRIKKLIKKFFNHPPSVKYQDIRKILLYLGFHDINTKGSHRKFKNDQLQNDLIIPVHNNDCKDFYKHQAAKIAKKILKNINSKKS